MSLPLHDPAWLERMYNNRALVPDHMDYLQRWAQDSAQVRANVPCVLDVAYGAEAGETLDIFPSVRPGAAGAPVLVFIHGGYWRSLDKSDHSFIAPPFTQAGCCVVVVNYALCPGTPESPVTVPTSAGRWKRLWPGCGAISPSMAVTREGSPWRGTLPVGSWRPCCSPVFGR